MANTLDIRRRIKSVKNTAQITRAMQMVAASKMRKAQVAAAAGRSYEELLFRVLASLQGRVDPKAHPLLQIREVRRELIVVFTSDKGLCGPLHTNLFRELLDLNHDQTEYAAAGKKGVQFLARTRRKLIADFQVSDQPQFKEIRPIGKLCIDKFISGEIDRVRVLYPKFINTLNQKPTLRTLLPIPVEELGLEKVQNPTDYLFEPSEQEILSGILPHYLVYLLYQMLLDERASEHSARMVAMKNATDNAKQIVKDLTLDYNKIRQASITTELNEISTAQLALE
jgi:F-type H+-transporting ATPase subunit gamma